MKVVVVSRLELGGREMRRWEMVPGSLGCALTMMEVTMPKVLPPPPRRAQKRSSEDGRVEVMKWPDAVTSSIARTLSAARP